MIFIIKGLKYDTSKMELISDRVRTVEEMPEGLFTFGAKIYKSKKGKYLLVNYFKDAKIIKEKKVKQMLFEHDIKIYERLFGEIEEG